MATTTENTRVLLSNVTIAGEGSAPKSQEAPSANKLPKKSGIPTFENKYEERKWAKAQMAAAFRVFAKLGYADGVAGHVSLRGTHTVSENLGHMNV